MPTARGSVWLHDKCEVTPYAGAKVWGWVQTERYGSVAGPVIVVADGRYSFTVPTGALLHLRVAADYQPCVAAHVTWFLLASARGESPPVNLSCRRIENARVHSTNPVVPRVASCLGARGRRNRIDAMTDWFARPVLHVSGVEASLRFYVHRLGIT
jgi:hypothetical protein